jgi:flagellar hook assembly protein FlgD
MYKFLSTLLVVGVLLTAASISSNAQEYKLERFVIANGGVVNATNADGYTLNGAVGQTAVQTVSTSSPVIDGKPVTIHQGFWVGTEMPTGVDEVVADNGLANYPNPFNYSTTIKFNLQHASYVTVRIFDMAGNLVKTLASSELMSEGQRELPWNAQNEANIAMGSGSYLYEVMARPAQLAGPSAGTVRMRDVMVLVK